MSMFGAGLAGDGAAGEDRLLLRELTHRVGNDYGTVVAAVRLALRGVADERSRDLLERVLERVEASGDVHRLLARPVPETADLATELGELCVAMRAAGPAAGASRLRLDLPPTPVEGAVARRVLLVAAELLANAFRHALHDRAGELAVTLRRVDGALVLVIADDGPGATGAAAASSGTGWGRGIVAELVANAGGTIAVDATRPGTAVCVELPAGGAVAPAPARRAGRSRPLLRLSYAHAG